MIRFLAFVLGALALMAAFVELSRTGNPDDRVRTLTLEAPLGDERARCAELSVAAADADAGCQQLWSDLHARFFGPVTAPDRHAER